VHINNKIDITFMLKYLLTS